ncbi:LysR substrate-binding domain-containing protein [Massilia sp. SM-13]|uniref:LysR substrate-binding domain-containing protein n=1 Tax=Pseudoduganella rhizocola TaxID=3382643 RepID=UPI0038B449E3
MRRVTFDLDALRSFSEGMDSGSFARAAQRLNRSTSAVSAHLRKLEEQAGTPILRKEGRGLALTEAGEVLLSYARRMLALNDEAAMAVGGKDLAGAVRLGFQEDFSAHLLPGVLGAFGRSHPGVRIEARIGRNAELLAQIQAAELDLALMWSHGDRATHMELLGEHPLHWIGPADDSAAAWLRSGEPVPLVAVHAPCHMRSYATDTLDRHGIPWRIAVTSPSLGGVWAAVSAGLGLAVRPVFGMPAGLRTCDEGYPALPTVNLALRRAEAEPGPVCERLREIIRRSVAR